ncbi:MAG TPA: hypothetical protein VEX14_13375 [Burkholderiaceae bacterium]|jgi:hypothetical protein|nr:hypothetical protein [Burkholderiaceae bacterium]
MKLLWTALAFFSAGAVACPADDAKDAQAPQDKSMAAAKAPVRATTPTKTAVSKKAQTTNTKVAADTTRKSPL